MNFIQFKGIEKESSDVEHQYYVLYVVKDSFIDQTDVVNAHDMKLFLSDKKMSLVFG